MELFSEINNYSYELITYLLSLKKSFTEKELRQEIRKFLPMEDENQVMEMLFPSNEEGFVFRLNDGKYEPILSMPFPVRNTNVEKQATKTLTKTPYAADFLSRALREKLEKATAGITEEWSLDDIKVRGQYLHGITQIGDDLFDKLQVIRRAIKEGRAIAYTYVRGKVENESGRAFPVKIEYSFLNDMYRICAVETDEKICFKMNIDAMSKVALTDMVGQNVQESYERCMKAMQRTIELEIEPETNAVERCFQLFSFYDRGAAYDTGENRYRLKITYYAQDESEIIRDILSLGASVEVIAPDVMRQMVIERIRRIIAVI